MSDEVSDFLRSVELLKGRREEEDEARSRELEQKILQEKKERQARRAERARSISPQKSSPVNTPSPTSKRLSLAPAADGIGLSSPSLDRIGTGSPKSRVNPAADMFTMDGASEASISPTKENDSPFDSDVKRTSLTYTSASSAVPSARSPLPWQRRPRSQTTERPRPLSVVAAENAASSRTSMPPEPRSVAEPDLTRDQIAQSLAGKDPSWFRQTSDRGQGSAAFRRNQVEDSDTLDMSSLRTQLPGMSREPSAEPTKETPPPPSESQSPALKLGPALPLTATPRLDPPTKESTEDSETPELQRQPTGRSSPTRPVSPTKGMGGFVQSAMLKRSDSVKRWSVTSPGGLQRADSSSSVSRNTIDFSHRTTPKTASRPASMLRDESFSSPRPTSSHEKKEEGQTTPTAKAPEPEPEEHKTPPSSPSKTMDPRRWSPTKSSSWLEAALNKPESPKPKQVTPAASNQPAWMVELNKAKAQKSTTTTETDRTPSLLRKHEVKTGGLMRHSPMGTNVKPTGPGVYPVALTSDKLPTPDLRSELRPPSRRGSEDPDSGSGASGSESASAPKTKTETPATKDFRANLKPRVPPPSTNASGPPDELKNVFGNLRRTKTQNYKAPDELKSNILRGKAALNATGGPHKSDRKDEFKEAILKKKEDFKKAQQEGRGVTRAPSSVSESSIPEGLVKKMELGRSGTTSRPESSASDYPLESPSLTESNRSSAFSTISRRDTTSVAPSAAQRFSAKLEKVDKEPALPVAPSVGASKPASAPGRLSAKIGGGLADRFNPALAGLLAKGPPGASGPAKTLEASSGTRSEESLAAPGPQLTHMTKGRARGPKRKAPSSVPKPEETVKEHVSVAAPLQKEAVTSPKPEKPAVAPKPASPPRTEKPSLSPKPVVAPKPDVISLVDSRKPLIQRRKSVRDVVALVDSSAWKHEEEVKPAGQPIALVDSSAFKTRPRSPTKVHEQVAALAAKTQQASKSEEDVKPAGQPITLVDSSTLKTRPRSPTKVHEQVAALAAKTQQTEKSEEEIKPTPQPTVDSWAPKTRPRSPTKVQEQLAALVAKTQQASKPADSTADPASQPPSPKKLVLKRMSKFLDEQGQPLSAKPDPEKSLPPSPIKNRFPDLGANSSSPKPPAMEDPFTSSKSTSALLSGVSISLAQAAPPSPKPSVISQAKVEVERKPQVPFQAEVEAETRPQVPPKGARPLPAPPGPGDSGAKTPPRKESTRPPSPAKSPTKIGREVAGMLTEFFGPERPKQKYTADAADILMRRPPHGSQIQTQSVQLYQISDSGKKTPVAAHYERVLFEREMYLCPHVFINSAGKKVKELYFWAGDEVPESTAEDTHLFAAREARAFGGKLVQLSQGKETPEFMQALGGIVIIRRGSSNKYDSLASNILCGRRYLGQVVFDEVDFAPTSLCSGFPYLINQQGKCYLWKGKGSDVDELSCARLVGMDLALMGELSEIEEGLEPPQFWDLFGGGSRAQSADHWRLKPNYERYAGRLFVANGAGEGHKQQISEIFPFKQTDLLPSNIYILDAFFEMYIIVGARSQHQYVAFHNALDFAHEYSILAAGMEDRPFVPISTVVLEGIPRDMKSVFRKWVDRFSPTVMNTGSSSSGMASGFGGNGKESNPVSPSPNVGGGGHTLRRGRSLRIVPLNQALLALKDQ
ncbi:protein of unknown function (DUF4045) domain containing protein [Rhypophila decipiens]